MSRGFSGGKQIQCRVKFVECESLFILSKRDDDLIVMQNLHFEYYVIIPCCEDIHGRYCIQKSNIEHLDL